MSRTVINVAGLKMGDIVRIGVDRAPVEYLLWDIQRSHDGYLVVQGSKHTLWIAPDGDVINEETSGGKAEQL